MVLLDEVVQILILTNLDICAFVIIIVIDAGSVGSAFVDIDFYISSLVKYNEVKYISDTLITTFAAEDRISNFCYDNKIVEVFEHFYLYEKIASIYSKYKAYSLNKCFIHLSSICDKYDITKISDIRDCGYIGKIHLSVRIYLLLKNVFGQFFIKKAILSVSRLGYLR